MGLGLLGRGIGDVRFLAKQGAQLIVTDLKTKEQLADSLKLLTQFKNITYRLGEHRLEDFRDRDMIIKAAGVPLDSPFIAEAKKHNIPVKMSTSLFAELTPATLVGITGTRGKSTTTHLIHEILKKAYKGKKQKVYLGGNVKGVSTLELLPKIKKEDIVVLELDSWQLQGFGESKISPHIAVFTTLMRDHMNYYKDNMQKYFNDKANIFAFQKKNDVLVVGKQVSAKIKKTVSRKIITDENDIPKSWKASIPGTHNRYNIALAIEAARVLNISEKVIKKSVESYKGVAGRLELIKVLKNRTKVYNDTTATTPDALTVALKALGTKKNITLIMGGAGKGLSMNSILAPIKKYIKNLIYLPGTGTDTIITNKKFSTLKPVLAKDMPDAVEKAAALIHGNDVLLLSPGFASFGLFKNEFDRGEQFNRLVKKLK